MTLIDTNLIGGNSRHSRKDLFWSLLMSAATGTLQKTFNAKAQRRKAFGLTFVRGLIQKCGFQNAALCRGAATKKEPLRRAAPVETKNKQLGRLGLFAAQGDERGQTAQTGQGQRGGFRNCSHRYRLHKRPIVTKSCHWLTQHINL